jgi:hypothetical protein
MRHEYHFILNEKLYFKLLKLSKRIDKNLSMTINFILENLSPHIEMNHLNAHEEESRYIKLTDMDEKRYHVHCYIPEQMYRKLKHLHLDLNTYSIAQTVRKLIDYFLRGFFKYGNRIFIEGVNKFKTRWETKKQIYIKEKHIFKNQMSYFKKHLPYCMTTYGKDSRPISIRLL